MVVRHRKLLILLACVALVFGMTACGGSQTEDTQEAKEETQEETAEEEQDETIEITGQEFTSGDLTVTIPEGWEICPGVEDWAADEHIKILETANKKEVGGSVYGNVYVEIEASDYSEMENAYNEESLKKYAEQYEDEEELPKDYTFNDNVYKGFRYYGYVGDSAEDWSYLAFTSGGQLIEIRAYVDGDLGNDDNRAAIKAILASLTVGGEALSVQ